MLPLFGKFRSSRARTRGLIDSIGWVSSIDGFVSFRVLKPISKAYYSKRKIHKAILTFISDIPDDD